MAKELDNTKEVLQREYASGWDRRGARHRWGRSGHPHGRDGRHSHGCRSLARGDRLTQVAPGMAVLVEHVHGDEIFRGKMMAMGIVPGASLSVLQGGWGRPLLIALAGGRLLLDSRSSELITVRTDGQEEGSKP